MLASLEFGHILSSAVSSTHGGTSGIAGLWGRSVVMCYLLSRPGALAAIYVGRIINRRLRGHAFLIYLHVGLIVVGGVLLAQATAV